MEFSLVDLNGNLVGPGVEALLLWKNGTVCNNAFTDIAADAICRALGHSEHGHLNWTSGLKWDIQSSYDIHLDNVECNSENWSFCSYEESHNCEDHAEDIFLVCKGPGEIER